MVRKIDEFPEVIRQLLAASVGLEALGISNKYVEWKARRSNASSADPSKLAHYPLTDLGNGERFRDRYASSLMHVPAIGPHWWDGARWSAKGAEEAWALAAHDTAREIQNEAAAIRGTDSDRVIDKKRDGTEIRYSDKLAAWGRSSESVAKLVAMQKCAAPYLSVDAGKLDADPFAINVQNGTIRVRRDAAEDEDVIDFRPHDPADLITKLAPVHYDPTATCPRFDRFVADVQPIPENRRFIFAWTGYALTGDTEEQKLAFFYGKGRNGKSTFMDAVGTVVGDYGETVPIETFLDQGRGRNAGAATPDLAILPGVRNLRTSEPQRGTKLDEGLIKALTGGEPIQARHLNRDYFKFRPAFKLTMAGNYRPRIEGTDEGIWRRVVLVPWSVTVEKPELHLLATLKGEASGILNRLLDGLRDYLENGLSLPTDVADATQDYREDSDPLGRFLALAVEPIPEGRIRSQRLHEVFVAWARTSGEAEWSAKGLARALKERGWRSCRSNGMYWLGHRLAVSDIDFRVFDPPDPPSGDGET